MKYVALMVFVAVLSAGCFAADWVSLARGTETEAGKILKSSSNSEIVVEINIPGYKASTKTVDGTEYTVLDLDGSSMIIEKGAPELRKVTAFVKVPKCAAVSAEMVDGTYVSKEVAPIIPSKGNILRNVNPEDVPYELGDAYKGDGWYPADNNLVTVSAPFKMRDIYGVRVAVTPFQYNHGTKTLKIYTKMVVAVKPVGIQKDFSFNLKPKVKEFENLYEDLFINYQADGSRLSAPQDKKQLLIVTHKDFYAAAQTLAAWKKKIGFAVEVKKVDEIGPSALEIQGYLHNKYAAGKLSHIILIGDDKYVPTFRGKYESAHSDPCYVKLDGNDNIMDAFISRISVQTAAQAEYVVMKSINYEKYPMQGADGAWYKSTLGIASAEGSPKDYERINVLNKALKDNLGYKVTTCYDQGYTNADKSIISRAVNAGINIIDYCGHGSETMWVSSRFNTSDARALKNGMKLPVIWSVACVNGAYVGRECFAEAWLLSGNKDNPAGCIGIAAATTNMAWVPPCVWQKHIILEETVKNKHTIAGVQHMYGVLKCMEEYGTDDRSYGNQLSEQTHYFGDGTVALRFAAPREITIDKARDGEALVINVRNAEGLKDCVITAYDDNMENVVVKALDERGASLMLNGQTHFTVYGPTIVPIVDEEI